MRLRKRFLAAGGTVVAGAALGLAQVGPSGAQEPASERRVSGDFSLIMMVHTTASTPNFTVPAINPWDGSRAPGRFTYRSIPCTGAAPINNISSDLPSYGARVRGSRAPSSLRAHPFRIRVRRARNGRGWELVGRMMLTVCQLRGGPVPAPDPVPDADKPKIDVRFVARFKRLSVENLTWQGRFTLSGGTGRYEDLTGSGRIAGYFFCFNPQGCQSTGRKYLDGQLVMQGDYRDPTPQLAAG